jgi:hypothetical protein
MHFKRALLVNHEVVKLDFWIARENPSSSLIRPRLQAQDAATIGSRTTLLAKRTASCCEQSLQHGHSTVLPVSTSQGYTEPRLTFLWLQ